MVCRYGGEEFLVVLPGADLDAGTEVGERLRRAAAEPVRVTGGRDVTVTVSVGVAGSRAAGERDWLLHEADAALYQAKKSGRNRVCCGTPGVTAAP